MILNLLQRSDKDLQLNIYSRKMNCARVLHAFGSHSQPAVMPVDLAKCLTLSQRRPLYELLSMSPLKPTQRRYQPTNCPPRTSLPSPHPTSPSSPFTSPPSPRSSPVPSSPRSCFRRDSGGLNKKRVVFADAKGLALTAVRLFIPEPSSSPVSSLVMKPSLARLQGQQSTSNKLQRYKLRLGFPQPTLDFKAFLTRLRDMCVQLESCNISEHSLSGKVCVSHVSTDKAVHVRVTFDSWRSHHDIPCTLLQQHCGGSDMDIFTFDLSLPKNIDPKERVEFFVSFRPGPGATPHWDNNRGQNYRLCMETDGSDGYQGNTFRYRPPSWPSYVSLRTQNSADPQQYLQRSLSNSQRVENPVLT